MRVTRYGRHPVTPREAPDVSRWVRRLICACACERDTRFAGVVRVVKALQRHKDEKMIAEPRLEIQSLVVTLQQAFLDAPALRLTLPDAQRHCGAGATTCEAVLNV